jgi:hypothetical protein
MNYIHSGYQASGKISHDDLLYTLSVFMTEPPRWIERYEWRTFTPMEICAVGTFWKGVADSMFIDYQSRLEGGISGKGWKDGIEFWEDVARWARRYEEKCMVPAVTNKQTGDETANMLMYLVPDALKPAGKVAISVFMEERLREAMMYEKPPAWVRSTVLGIFAVRKFVLRYLTLPRPDFLRVNDFTEQNEHGRYTFQTYKVHPYYAKPTFWNRWGPEALLTRLFGGEVPGSEKFLPKGYKFEEIGPEKMANRGKDVTDKFEERLKVERTPGCPFSRR